MNRRICTLAVVFLMLFIFTGASAQTEKMKTLPKAPEGWVIVEEDYLFFLDDEPQTHFEKAKESFLEGDKKATAKEIRKAVVFMKLEESRATAEGKEALSTSIDELNKLADDIEKGAAVSDKDLDHAFARAHQALTKHHLSKAKEEYGKDSKKAGYELKAAANHLEYAVKWSGGKMEEGFDAGVSDARTIAGKIIDGAGWTAEKVSKAMEYLANESDKLGKKVEPKKK